MCACRRRIDSRADMLTPAHIAGLIPGLPLLAAGVGACSPRRARAAAVTSALVAMAAAMVLSFWLLVETVSAPAKTSYANFAWFEVGATSLRLGWLLDPLGAFMIAMVTSVGLLIFVFSLGYMAKDE